MSENPLLHSRFSTALEYELVTVSIVVNVRRTLQRHTVQRGRRALLGLRFRRGSGFDCFIGWTDVGTADCVHHGVGIGRL